MPTTLHKPSKLDTVMWYGLIGLLIAFFISLSFMIMDKQEREAKEWQDLGCRKYDNYKIADIPAKCHGEFIEKYKAQEQRVQPPDEK